MLRARDFVEARGNAFERLRAQALVGEVSGRDVLAQAMKDGAFAAPEPDAALALFEALDPARQLSGPEVEALVARLTEQLGEDGSWGAPGEPEEARLVRTGLLGGYLAKTLMLRPRFGHAIDAYLSRHWDEELVKTGSWEPIAAFTLWFSMNDSELSDGVLQWCGRELDRGFRTKQFDAVTTSRIFVLCDALALPGSSLSALDLCEAIANEQTEEGGFALGRRSLAGEPVADALDAMASLVHLGRLGPRWLAGR